MERWKRFEDLPVWQEAIRLGLAVFDLTGSGRLQRQGDLINQLERASLSVSNNIAEGWERGTQEELLTFLYYAKGSCGEVRSMLRFLSHRVTPEIAREVNGLLDLALNTSRQLGGWIESAENSPAQGPRSRNETTRNARLQAHRASEFLDKLRTIQDEARRLTEQAKEPE